MKYEIQVNYKGAYDVIVVGSGPAGVAAAIRAGRNGAKTLLIESKKYQDIRECYEL